MVQKSAKTTIDIRPKLKVTPESLEAQIDQYLKEPEVIPHDKHELIIDALRTYWQVHLKYLQRRLGIDLTESAPPSIPSTSASIPQPKRKPEPETEPQRELEEDYVQIFDLN